ncbi:MAG: SpoIIE family protein phosphatase [Leptospiraceae bacterium]|nr:SpoIIE family protein phosphatase [Leptospiraceae bacterium]
MLSPRPRITAQCSKLAVLLTLSLPAFGCQFEGNAWDLGGSWQFRRGFQADWLAGNQTGEWQSAAFPIKFNEMEPYKRDFAGSYTLRYPLPAELGPLARQDTVLALQTPTVSDIAVFFINQHQIGSLGDLASNRSGTYKQGLFSFPAHYIRSNAPNFLYIHLHSDGIRPPLIRSPLARIGSNTRIQQEYRNELALSFFLLAAYFAVGAYHMVLGLRRPKDSYNIYFGLFCILISFYWVFRSSYRDYLFEDVDLRMKLEFITLYLAGPILVGFFDRFFQGRLGWTAKGYFLYAVLLSTIAAVSSYTLLHQTLLAFQITIPLALGYVLYLVIFHLCKANIDAWYLATGTIILIGSILHDLMAARGYINSPHIARYGFGLFIAGIAGILANRFVRTQIQVEELNHDLEGKVTERTRQLEESLENVRHLKVQQDGDYYLTSLLIQPLGGVFDEDAAVRIDYYIKQKKQFYFKKWHAEIGGDLVAAYALELQGQRYMAVVNGDAMGKSIQGAGGALVLGTVFKSVVTRTQLSSQARQKSPERWIKDCFVELQNIFVSFDGSMLISAFIALIDTTTGTLYYLNAEHPFAVLYRDHTASFIEDQLYLRKIGWAGIEGHIEVRLFGLQPGDVLLLGSDGRDDLDLGQDEAGWRKINEDEFEFLRSVAESKGQLNVLPGIIASKGGLTDDLSLVRIEYQPVHDPALDTAEDTTELGSQILVAIKSGELEHAAVLCQRGMELDPGNYSHPYHLGLVYSKQKQYQKALQLFTKSFQLNQAHHLCLFQLARMNALLNDLPAAIEYGERLRIRDRKYLNNLIQLANCYHLSGNHQRAGQLLAEAEDLDPGNEHIEQLQDRIAKKDNNDIGNIADSSRSAE